MTPAAELRLLRRLGAPGVVMMQDGPDGWAAFPAGDRRRRALARCSNADMRTLLSSGAVTSGAARALTPEGRARLARLRAGDGAFADQHRHIAPPSALRDDAASAPPVNLAESPLGRLARPGADPLLAPAELAAGERLREDLARSTYNARVTMDWSAPPAGKGAARAGGRDPAGAPDAALAARARVNAALDYVAPPLSGALLDFLWRELPLEAVERAQGWPRRSGRLGLKLGLHRLALHYGMVTQG